MKVILNLHKKIDKYKKRVSESINLYPYINPYEKYMILKNEKKMLVNINIIFCFIRIFPFLFLLKKELSNGVHFLFYIDFFYILIVRIWDYFVTQFLNSDNYDNFGNDFGKYVLYGLATCGIYECFYFIYSLYLIYNYYVNSLIFNILSLIIIGKIILTTIPLFNCKISEKFSFFKMSKNLSVNLYIDKIKFTELDDCCGICLEKFKKDEYILRMNNCSHYYHESCILKWFKQGKVNCPMCRKCILY